MNREIRFRIWDGKKMRYNVAVNQSIAFYIPTGLGEYQTISVAECEVMQYIGLKDKNGREIYEGDIVKWGMYEGSEEYYHRYAVVEINPDIQFKILFYIDSKTGERKQTDNHIFRFGNFAYKDTQKHLEIIGNIHDNPELLEQ